MRPFIGVTSTSDAEGRPDVKPAYARAILRAGGLPVPLPFVSDAREASTLLSRLDGIVFSGSDDLDPALWGEALHPSARLMHPARATTELLLAHAALDRGAPALGVCGGMQTLNVAAGGSLHQHIPDLGGALDHKDPTFLRRHAITVAEGSKIGEWLGRELLVNTEHHQAVNALGRGLRAVAVAEDGIIEAWEADGVPFLVGVQWHPERMEGDPRQQRLFEALVRAATGVS